MESVLVLMSTYNGEKYLEEQIKSIFNQKDVIVKLLIRDDGSTDDTILIVKKLQETYPIQLITGQNVGYARSFMELVVTAKNADYYAFCDQDDVWLPEKLITAINNVKTSDDNIPSLYMSQAIIVDNNLNNIEAKFHKRYISLDKLIAHNFAIGCTMVFNESLRKILDNRMMLDAGHDYWVSCVAAAVNAFIYWDKNGYVLYRQHGNNVSGKIVSIKQAIAAVKKILVKWKNVRESIAKCLLENYVEYISEDNVKTLTLAADYRKNLGSYLRFLFSPKYMSKYMMADIITKLSILICAF